MTAVHRSRSVLARLALLAVLLALAGAVAEGQTGGGFDLTWSTIDGGGGTSSAPGGYEVGGTIGQPDAGTLSGPGFTLDGGFWAAVIAAPVTSCTGDCSGEGTVTVDELLIMVNIALGNAPVSDCQAGDPGGDGEITIDEILTAVNGLLDGCPRT